MLYAARVPVGQAIRLKVTTVLTDMLSNLPKEVAQNEKQKVVYSFDAYVTSPYATEKQVTHVKLPSGEVEEYRYAHEMNRHAGVCATS